MHPLFSPHQRRKSNVESESDSACSQWSSKCYKGNLIRKEKPYFATLTSINIYNSSVLPEVNIPASLTLCGSGGAGVFSWLLEVPTVGLGTPSSWVPHSVAPLHLFSSRLPAALPSLLLLSLGLWSKLASLPQQPIRGLLTLTYNNTACWASLSDAHTWVQTHRGKCRNPNIESYMYQTPLKTFIKEEKRNIMLWTQKM